MLIDKCGGKTDRADDQARPWGFGADKRVVGGEVAKTVFKNEGTAGGAGKPRLVGHITRYPRHRPYSAA